MHHPRQSLVESVVSVPGHFCGGLIEHALRLLLRGVCKRQYAAREYSTLSVHPAGLGVVVCVTPPPLWERSLSGSFPVGSNNKAARVFVERARALHRGCQRRKGLSRVRCGALLRGAAGGV